MTAEERYKLLEAVRFCAANDPRGWCSSLDVALEPGVTWSARGLGAKLATLVRQDLLAQRDFRIQRDRRPLRLYQLTEHGYAELRARRTVEVSS